MLRIFFLMEYVIMDVTSVFTRVKESVFFLVMMFSVFWVYGDYVF